MATVTKGSRIEYLRMHGGARFLRVGLGVYPRQFVKKLQGIEGKRVARRFVAERIEDRGFACASGSRPVVRDW